MRTAILVLVLLLTVSTLAAAAPFGAQFTLGAGAISPAKAEHLSALKSADVLSYGFAQAAVPVYKPAHLALVIRAEQTMQRVTLTNKRPEMTVKAELGWKF